MLMSNGELGEISQFISGASQKNNIAAFSPTTEVDGVLFENVKETTKKQT